MAVPGVCAEPDGKHAEGDQGHDQREKQEQCVHHVLHVTGLALNSKVAEMTMCINFVP
jgi:hypothetical protein